MEQGEAGQRRVHHLGIIVRDLEKAIALYRDGFGLSAGRRATLADQGVKAAFLHLENASLEFIQPLDGASGVGRYLARRGEGLHHICLTARTLRAEIADLEARGVELIDHEPRPGLAGNICFFHPRAHAGVLVELVEWPGGEANGRV